MRHRSEGAQRWKEEAALGRRLLLAARVSGSEFSRVFDEADLEHHLEQAASIGVLLWAVTAGQLRMGRRRSLRFGFDPNDLVRAAALTSGPKQFDAGRAHEFVQRARRGAVAVPELAADVPTSRGDLYTASTCCNAAIDHRMRTSTMLSDSWQKRYKISARALRFQLRRRAHQTQHGSP